jgi:hypothetical protein
MDTPFSLGAPAPHQVSRVPIAETDIAIDREMNEHRAAREGGQSKRRMLISGAEDTPDNGVWMPIDLPSMGLAGYPARIYVRKFGLPDLTRLGGARKLNSYSHTVSAIGKTLHGMPVELLTHGDLDYIMNWHEINSLPKSTKKLRWTSRYGHVNEVTVTETTRETINIENVARVEELLAKGYDFPRVGDELWRLHMVDAGKFNDPDNETEFALASYAMVDDPTNFEAKLAKIRADTDSLDFYEGLHEWRTVADHGIKTRTLLTCTKFDPTTAINDIQQSLAMLDASASMGEFDDEMHTQSTSLIKELAALRKLEAADKLSEAKAVEEEVMIPLDVSNFFPYVL